MAAPPPLPISPGASVAVQWPDGTFYFAHVLQAVPGGYRVRFADGAVETIAATSIINIPQQPVFRAGDEVLAVWKTDRMFPGTITGVQPAGYTVAWHDGDPPLIVPLGKLTHLNLARALTRAMEEPASGKWMDVTTQVLGSLRNQPPPLPGPASSAASPAQQPPLPAGVTLTIFIPGDVRPVERGMRFVEPLQDALRAAKLGDVTDEGTKLAETGGRPTVAGCYIQTRVIDPARGVDVIRRVLIAAKAPAAATITQHQPSAMVYSLY